MKIFHKILLVSFVSFSLFSCSKDDIDENEQLYGTWENVKVEDGYIRTFSLVFGREVVGKTYRTEDSDGRVVSNHTIIGWVRRGDIIEISSEETYRINSKGQLISNEFEDVVLDKTSSYYPEYYDEVK